MTAVTNSFRRTKIIFTLGPSTESEAMLDVLRRLQCDYAQGYLIARPSTDPADWATWRAPAAPARPGTHPRSRPCPPWRPMEGVRDATVSAAAAPEFCRHGRKQRKAGVNLARLAPPPNVRNGSIVLKNSALRR